MSKTLFTYPEVSLDVAAEPEVLAADVADVALLAAVAHGGVVVQVSGVAEDAVAFVALERRRNFVTAVPRHVKVETPFVSAKQVHVDSA